MVRPFALWVCSWSAQTFRLVRLAGLLSVCDIGNTLMSEQGGPNCSSQLYRPCIDAVYLRGEPTKERL